MTVHQEGRGSGAGETKFELRELRSASLRRVAFVVVEVGGSPGEKTPIACVGFYKIIFGLQPFFI